MGSPPTLPAERTWRPLVSLAVREDIGPGDVTTPLVVEFKRRGSAILEAREPLLVCGLDVAFAVFHAIDSQLSLEPRTREGETVVAGAILATATGSLRSILAAERTALNFLMRMCGVASWTRLFVDAVEGTGVQIVDTRKTLPGWRCLDKYATAIGGATNHRAGLFDGVLLKDNHIAIAGGIGLAVAAARASAPAGMPVQVEVESETQAVEAVEAGADLLLLDNRTLKEIKSISARLAGRIQLEVSGGVHLDNVREIAETGVHRISIGALTHSAPAVDVALEIQNTGEVPAEIGA